MDQIKNYPKTSQAILLLVFVFFLQIIFLTPIAILGAILNSPIAEHPAAIGVVNLCAIGTILIGGIKRARASFQEVLPFRPVPLSLLLPIALTVIGLSILLSETDNLLRTVLPMPAWLADFFERVLGAQASLWGSAFTLVIVAPLTEELLFRGLILRGFLSHYSAKKAILVSAILFGLFHLNPWQFTSAAVLGALFAWWFVQTKSLLPCLFGHALTNALPLIFLSLLQIKIPGYSSELTQQVEFQPLWFDLIGLILAGLGLWLLVREFKKNVLTTQDSQANISS
jgi:membrane protease YdiL (CAAX protease family)